MPEDTVEKQEGKAMSKPIQEGEARDPSRRAFLSRLIPKPTRDGEEQPVTQPKQANPPLIGRKAVVKGLAALGGAALLNHVVDRARRVFGQPPLYRVLIPIAGKDARGTPEIKQGMYGTWQKEIKFRQNGYEFGIENGEKAGLVVRNWQPLLRLNEHYGQLHGYKSFTVSFKDESELTQEMRDQMKKLPMAYKDDPESDQILFYRKFERQPGTPPYGSYGFLPVWGEYRESFVDTSGNLHLRLSIALFNTDKYKLRIDNLDPRDVLPSRITESILWSIWSGGKTNRESSELVSEYLAGREPFPRTEEWRNEYSAPGTLHEEYLFRVKV